jgi:hypothetical protein
VAAVLMFEVALVVGHAEETTQRFHDRSAEGSMEGRATGAALPRRFVI